MRSKSLIFLPILLVIMFSIYGCGIRYAMSTKEVPLLKDYSRVAIVFFSNEASEKYDNLPMLFSYTTGTKISIKCQDKDWVFDQSENNCPVGERLKNLGIDPCEICQNYELAKVLGQALEADLIIVGRLDKPSFVEERSGKVEYDMAKVDVTGAARYYAVYQTALLKANFEIIDPKICQPIWDGRVMGYKKYKTLYRTGNPPKSMREETMLNDVRMDLIQNFVELLYPAMSDVPA